MSNLIIQENMIKCKYNKINNDSGNNNNNSNDSDDEIKPNNDDNDNDDNNGNNDNDGNDNNNSKYDVNNADNKENEIVSFMSITVVKNIFNPVSCYIDPASNQLECLLSLVNIEIKSYQELNLVEYDMFYQSENSILGCSKLSENIQNEPNIPFNSKYI